MRPRLLDLFCGAGGAAMGYYRAGFDVVGVDINPQPNYPFEFIQADVIGLRFLRTRAAVDFDAIHASPPCQAYSRSQAIQGNEHPELVAPTRELLRATGLPYVIENVVGAPLIDPVVLCGASFGRPFCRHRLFELNWQLGSLPWAARDEISEAIPPVFTQWIGERLLAHLSSTEGVRVSDVWSQSEPC